MPSYDCPFCGYEIDKENVLFAYETTNAYVDERHESFLKLCASQWNVQRAYPKLYFRLSDASDPERTRFDVNGFPLMIRVRPSMGHTPGELEEAADGFKPRLTDYIAMFRNKQAGNTPAAATRAHQMGVFGLDESEQGMGLREIKPYDDGEESFLAQRVCPNCHCYLHSRFGRIETHSTTLLGGTSAGKTAYLIALINQLNAQLGRRSLGSARLLPPSQLYYEYLYGACMAANGTAATPKGEKLFPFVFYYKNGRDECFISIYDIAGEDVKEDATAMLNHRGAQEASTLLLMIDPNQLNDGDYFKLDVQNRAAALSTGGEDDSIGLNIGTCYNKSVDEFLTTAISANLDQGILNHLQHVIFVLTKMDMPLKFDSKLFEVFEGEDCLVKKDIGDAHIGGIDAGVIMQIHNEIDVYLAHKLRIEPGEPTQKVWDAFPSIATLVMLGVSVCTLKDPRTNEFDMDWNANASKHRIIEPFLMLLYVNQMIECYNHET